MPYLKHIPAIVKPLARDLVFRERVAEPVVYLTFDDGPHPTITPWVLDQLENADARATFFVVGNRVEQYPHVVQRILDEGHSLGHHTFDHVSGWKTPDDLYFDQILRTQLPVESRLFRPPYGQITRTQTAYLKNHFRIIMWSDLSADFDARYSADQCAGFATKHVRAGSIVVFHDSDKAWPRLQSALPLALEHYKRSGFSLRALPMNGSPAR